jgi:hypothetical protein
MSFDVIWSSRHRHKNMNLQKALERITVKGLIIPVVMGLLGWGGHTLLSAYSVGIEVDNHTQQLKALWDSQRQTHNDIQTVVNTVTRIDGKIDVLNQKIDDDRRAANHGR